MADRSGHRNRGEGRRPPRSGPPYGRRNPPPEETGSEAAYLQHLVKVRQAVTIETLDGGRVHGTLLGFDPTSVEIEQDGGIAVRVRRGSIRYVLTETENRR